MKSLQSSIVALFVLAAVCLAGTVYFYSQVEGERKALAQAEKNKTDMERKIQESQKLMDEKSQSLTSLETQVDELKAEIRTKNQEVTKNRTSIAQQESKVKDLTEKIRVLEKENKDLKARVDYFEKQAGAGDFSSTTSTTPDGLAVIEEGGVSTSENTSNPAPEKNQSSGKVILVNREYHFVVVGLGKLDGINLKDQMDIVRGDQVVGKVAVSKLYDSLSSCEILQDGKMPIQEGDIVRILAKA